MIDSDKEKNIPSEKSSSSDTDMIDIILVEAGGIKYAVPISDIQETLRVSPDDFLEFSGQRVVNIRETTIPVFSLNEFFTGETDPPLKNINSVIVVSCNNQRLSLLVDRIIGTKQISIHSFEENYRSIAGISGAAILENGLIILILDSAGIIMALSSERKGINLTDIEKNDKDSNKIFTATAGAAIEDDEDQYEYFLEVEDSVEIPENETAHQDQKIFYTEFKEKPSSEELGNDTDSEEYIISVDEDGINEPPVADNKGMSFNIKVELKKIISELSDRSEHSNFRNKNSELKFKKQLNKTETKEIKVINGHVPNQKRKKKKKRGKVLIKRSLVISSFAKLKDDLESKEN